MPKKNLTTDDSTDEPPEKISKTEDFDLDTNLYSLPNEALMDILEEINVWHYDRIRRTSKRLRDVVDSLIMHKFLLYLTNIRKSLQCEEEKLAAETVNTATEYLTRNGYQSTFSGCLLHLWRESYRRPLNISEEDVTILLQKFFKLVIALEDPHCVQHIGLLFNLTLLRLLKSFSKFSIISSEKYRTEWSVVMEIDGIWLGKTSKDKNRVSLDSLMAAIAALLIAHNSNTLMKSIVEAENDLYAFGNEIHNKRYSPKTLFSFRIAGSSEICNLFYTIFKNDFNEKYLPESWPEDDFNASMNISCRKCLKKGFSQSMSIQFDCVSEK